MRKVLLASLAIWGALMLSCSPEKMPEGTKIDPTPVEATAISASATSLSFTAEGGKENVTITSNFSWETISKPSWITVSPNRGSNGTTSVTVTAETSTSTSARTGTITLGNSSKSVSISVSQSAATVNNKISASVTSLNFSAGGESKVLNITSNFVWETIDKPSWITLSPSSNSNGTNSMIVSADESYSTSYRIGTITLGNSLASVSISVSQAVAQRISSETFIVGGIRFKMMKVEGGILAMKSSTNAPLYHSNVEYESLSPYYIGETEVTQELWTAVMGNTPGIYFIDPKRPVHSISWEECQNFIAKLNSLTGRNFRLPTRSEWLFAAVGGNNGKGYKYSGSNDIDEVAWFQENVKTGGWPDEGPHSVATKKANELGLYDMSGNVDEIVDERDERNYYWSIGGSVNSRKVNDDCSPYSANGRILQINSSWDTGFRLAM